MKTLSFLLFSALLATAVPSPAQYDGTIDLDESVRRQIADLEGMVGGDASATRQAAVLLWLAELYASVGDNDRVESCYERIIVFFPNDVATMNRYAEFLISVREDYERADSVLTMANRWARYIDERSVYRGKTWEIWAGLAYIDGEYALASRRAELALELIEGEDRVVPLRILGRSYREMGHYDLAADVFFELIALEGATVAEDINELQLFIAKTTKYNQGSVREHIDRAVAAAATERMARIEAGGGTVVWLEGDDGVSLEGTLRRASGPGAVLFVPDAGGRRSVYTPYEQLLFIDDITTLSVDPRGHGASRSDSLLSYDHLSPYHRSRIPDDIDTAFRYLRDLGFAEDRIVIVSEGQGCAFVEKALREGNFASPVTHLSPAFNPGDLELANAISFHPDRPVLLLFSDEDIVAVRSSSAYRSAKEWGRLETRMYRDAGHGVDMLRRSDEALETFQVWTRATVASP